MKCVNVWSKVCKVNECACVRVYVCVCVCNVPTFPEGNLTRYLLVV